MAILLLLTKEIRENLPFFSQAWVWEQGGWCWAAPADPSALPVISQCRWDPLPHGSRWGKQKGGMSCKDLLGSNSRFIHADRIQRPPSQEWHPSEQVGDLHGILLLAPSIAETEIRFLGTNPNDSSLLLRSHWEGRRDLFSQKSLSPPPLVLKKNATDFIIYSFTICLWKVVIKQLISTQHIIWRHKEVKIDNSSCCLIRDIF